MVESQAAESSMIIPHTCETETPIDVVARQCDGCDADRDEAEAAAGVPDAGDQDLTLRATEGQWGRSRNTPATGDPSCIRSVRSGRGPPQGGS